jgi:hypothetical protein
MMYAQYTTDELARSVQRTDGGLTINTPPENPSTTTDPSAGGDVIEGEYVNIPGYNGNPIG